MFEFKKFFTTKHIYISFKNNKLVVWDRWYWLVQSSLVGIPYPLYYSKFKIEGWENVPHDKPIIFAESHRNAFMDSLACVSTHSTQIWQLARGDAFNHPMMAKIYYFLHMLPIWRERDEPGSDTKMKNQETFDVCYDLLAQNANIGIYPEGDCVNENHIRTIKKGICRIAFGAEEKYNFNLDIQIVPVGVTYTAADQFKKWAIIQFGKPISVKDYIDLYRQNNASGINKLKDAIEAGMKKTALHIKKTGYFLTKDAMTHFYSREKIIQSGKNYEPGRKLALDKKFVNSIESLEVNNHDQFAEVAREFNNYRRKLRKFNFRENTFDKAKHHWLANVFMVFYFLFMLPVFVYGLIVNFIPYKIPEVFVKRKIKLHIFHSSIKYVIGIFLFAFYYLILFFAIWIVLGSILSAGIFLISFPISGHIAFYYRRDFIKWIHVLRFMKLLRSQHKKLLDLIHLRTKVFSDLDAIISEKFT